MPIGDYPPPSEGRRIFNLCVTHGARPGNVKQWLQQKLERLAELEKKEAFK